MVMVYSELKRFDHFKLRSKNFVGFDVGVSFARHPNFQRNYNYIF